MASLGHVAIGLAAGRLYARGGDWRVLARSMLGFSVVSLLPDADVLGFPLGIPYGAPFGHRGATHSLAIALACGILAAVARRIDDREGWLRLGVFTALVVATHGALDAMTDGGRGIALLWPFSIRRIFFPWRPIPVAPIGRALLSREGLEVFLFELLAFAPFLAYALIPRRAMKRR